MDAKTLEALNGSIEKWKAIATGDGEDHGADNCPLCQMFNNAESEFCVGCPVFETTGREGCDDTPYHAWLKIGEHISALAGRKATTERAKEVALEEVRFLESLLPLAVNPLVGGKP